MEGRGGGGEAREVTDPKKQQNNFFSKFGCQTLLLDSRLKHFQVQPGDGNVQGVGGGDQRGRRRAGTEAGILATSVNQIG
jgi:hypothetical protein